MKCNRNKASNAPQAGWRRQMAAAPPQEQQNPESVLYKQPTSEQTREVCQTPRALGAHTQATPAPPPRQQPVPWERMPASHALQTQHTQPDPSQQPIGCAPIKGAGQTIIPTAAGWVGQGHP